MQWILRYKTQLFIVAFILAAVFYAAGINNLLPLSEDSSIYIILAQSIGKGLGYTYTAGPAPQPCNYYPYIYPYMLSPLLLSFPHNYLLLKLLNVGLTLLFLIVVLTIAPRLFKDESSVLMTPMVALCPLVSFYSHQILTEIPYMLFSIMAVSVLIEYEKKRSAFNIPFFLSVFVMALSYNTRLIGVSLCMSAALYFLLKKEFKKGILFFCISLLVVTLWLSHNILSSGKSAYTKEFLLFTKTSLDLAHRWVYNLVATVGKEFPDLFFYPWLSGIDPYAPGFILKFGVGFFTALAVTAGFVLKVKKEGIGFFDVYACVYFFVFYLSWTHHGARYLLPLLPFLLYYVVLGIKNLVRRESIFLGVIFFFIIINFTGNIKEIIKEKDTPEQRSFIRAVDWFKKNIPQGKIVISRYPSWTYVYSGNHGLKFLRTTDVRVQYRYIMKHGADYIIIDQNKIYRDDAKDYLFPLLAQYGDSFERVYASGEPVTYVYRVKK